MKSFLLIVEFITGILLIAAILLHAPRGEGLGGIGGQSHLFNYNKSMDSGLDKIIGILVAIFLGSAAVIGILL